MEKNLFTEKSPQIEEEFDVKDEELNEALDSEDEKPVENKHEEIYLLRANGCSDIHNSLYISREGDNLIEGFMHDGDFTNIIAPVKTGATELAIMMAVAVQYGAEFMGMKAKRTETLFINCDGSHKAVERSFANAINSFGKSYSYMQGPLLMDLSDILWNAEDGKQMEILEKAIDEKLEEYPSVKFIIVDSVSSLVSGSEFNSKAIKPVILGLRNTARKHKAALLYTVHTQKPGIEGITDMIENPETTGAHYSLSDISYALWQSKSDSSAFFLQAKDDMDIDKVIKMRRLPGVNQVFVPRN